MFGVFPSLPRLVGLLNTTCWLNTICPVGSYFLDLSCLGATLVFPALFLLIGGCMAASCFFGPPRVPVFKRLFGFVPRVRGLSGSSPSLVTPFGLPFLRGLSGVSVPVVPFSTWLCSGSCFSALPRLTRASVTPFSLVVFLRSPRFVGVFVGPF